MEPGTKLEKDECSVLLVYLVVNCSNSGVGSFILSDLIMFKREDNLIIGNFPNNLSTNGVCLEVSLKALSRIVTALGSSCFTVCRIFD